MTEPTDTRTAVLAAARKLFAEQGFDATSTRAITTAAGANLGAIPYHFGSKNALYEAVLESVAGPLIARVRAADADAESPLGAIEAIVRAVAGYLAEHPEVPSLMLRELALDRPAPAPQRRAMQAILGLVAERVRAGQHDGSIVAGDPVLLTFSVVAQPMYWSLVRRRLDAVFKLNSDDPKVRGTVLNHLVRFTRRGLSTERVPA